MSRRIAMSGLCIIITVLITFLLFACSKSISTNDTTVIKIGGLFDLTGPTADVGETYAEGAYAYFEWVNQNGGINGREVQLIGLDYSYNVAQALSLYHRLVNQEDVVGILGWGTGDTEALKKLISEDYIPYISGSYSEELTDVEEYPYNFIVAATYSDQAKAILHWIKQNWIENRSPRVALIYNDAPFGHSHVEDTRVYAKELGIQIVDEQIVHLTSVDASTQLAKMNEKEPDFAIIQQTWVATATILKDAEELGIKTTFVGLNWTAGEGLLSLAGESAEGFIGAIPHAFPAEGVDTIPGLIDIKAHLEGKGKSLAEIDQKFIQGWNSAQIMLEGVRLAGEEVTGQSLKASLEKLNQFDTEGLGAPVTFTSENHRGTNQIRLAQVINGQFVIISDYISH